MVVGVAGKIGSGKSAVAGMLADAGFRVIDVDRLGHRALVTERDRIVDAFGRSILSPDGQIDRRRLGALVFRREEARRRLEAIVHPVMVRSVTALVTGTAYAAIDAALLYPMGLHTLCDVVFWVRAPLLLRLYRAVIVDGRGATVLRAMWMQRGRRLKRPSAKVDTGSVLRRSVYNVATKDVLRRQVERMALKRRR